VVGTRGPGGTSLEIDAKLVERAKLGADGLNVRIRRSRCWKEAHDIAMFMAGASK